MLVLVPPSPDLRPFVQAYLCVCDQNGSLRGRPIRTAPRPGGVLTVNFGHPNRAENGALTPALSLLGVQTRARLWHADENSHFVMALLSPSGLARLAPGSGADLADAYVDLGAVVGDGQAATLLDTASARSDSVPALEHWLRGRLSIDEAVADVRLLDQACLALEQGGRVDVVAEHLGVTRRHLSRVLSRHLGLGAKAMLDLHRLDRSLRAVQSGEGGGIGFADQAHQIREWRRRLGTTPGRYARLGGSELSRAFGSSTPGPAFYV